MLSSSHALVISGPPARMLSWYHDILLSWFHALRLPGSHVFMLSRTQAPMLSCCHALPLSLCSSREGTRSPISSLPGPWQYRFRKSCSRRDEALDFENKGSPKMSPHMRLREAIETFVSSWTLVIGATASPRRVYTMGENLFSTGGRAREGGKAVAGHPGSPRSGFSPRR